MSCHADGACDASGKQAGTSMSSHSRLTLRAPRVLHAGLGPAAHSMRCRQDWRRRWGRRCPSTRDSCRCCRLPRNRCGLCICTAGLRLCRCSHSCAQESKPSTRKPRSASHTDPPKPLNHPHNWRQGFGRCCRRTAGGESRGGVGAANARAARSAAETRASIRTCAQPAVTRRHA